MSSSGVLSLLSVGSSVVDSVSAFEPLPVTLSKNVCSTPAMLSRVTDKLSDSVMMGSGSGGVVAASVQCSPRSVRRRTDARPWLLECEWLATAAAAALLNVLLRKLSPADSSRHRSGSVSAGDGSGAGTLNGAETLGDGDGVVLFSNESLRMPRWRLFKRFNGDVFVACGAGAGVRS